MHKVREEKEKKEEKQTREEKRARLRRETEERKKEKKKRRGREKERKRLRREKQKRKKAKNRRREHSTRNKKKKKKIIFPIVSTILRLYSLFASSRKGSADLCLEQSLAALRCPTTALAVQALLANTLPESELITSGNERDDARFLVCSC